MLTDDLSQQEKSLRREFYTANFNEDTVGIQIALKKLETVLFQEYKVHRQMANPPNA